MSDLATIPIKRPFKGRVEEKYFNDVIALHKNGYGSRKIAEIINEKYSTSYKYSNIIAVIHFINNEKKSSIESDFLDEVKNTTGNDLQRTEDLYLRFDRLSQQMELQNDYKNLFQAANLMIRITEIKLRATADAISNQAPATKEVNEKERAEALKHLLAKLDLKR